jgi:hypothetical protein
VNVNRIRFITSAGRSFQPPTIFQLGGGPLESIKGHIVGMFGRSDALIDQIGFYFAPNPLPVKLIPFPFLLLNMSSYFDDSICQIHKDGGASWPKRLKVGDRVNCLDTDCEWRNAEIIEAAPTHLLIHYIGWPNKWNGTLNFKLSICFHAVLLVMN